MFLKLRNWSRNFQLKAVKKSTKQVLRVWEVVFRSPVKLNTLIHHSPGIFGAKINTWLLSSGFQSTLLKTDLTHDKGEKVCDDFNVNELSKTLQILLYIKIGYLQIKITHIHKITFLLRNPSCGVQK